MWRFATFAKSDYSTGDQILINFYKNNADRKDQKTCYTRLESCENSDGKSEIV